MRISAKKRSTGSKSALKRFRHTGQIPAVLYQKGSSLPIVIEEKEFHSSIRLIKKGTLATTPIELDLEGNSYKVIVKGIEYHPVTESVLHLDFQPLIDGEKIEVNIPVMTTNPEESIGVKMGGAVKMVKRKVKVRCQPQHIPKEFLVDISTLDVGQVVRLEDLKIATEIELRVAPRDILVAINK